MRAVRVAVLSGVLAALTPTSASAQDDADRTRAERAFKQALADEQGGLYEKAVGELQEARTAAHKETPQLLYHLGVCHSHLGHLAAARDELRSAMERAQAQGLDNVAAAARTQLATVEAQLAASPPPPPTPIPVPPIPAPPPPTPTPTPTSTPTPIVTPPPPVSSSPPAASAPSHTLAWLSVIGGAALAAGGGIFWVLRSNEVNTLAPICGQSKQACPATAGSDISNGKLYDALGVTLFIAGGAAMLTGGGLLVFGGRSTSTTARLSPVLTAHGGGLGVQGVLW